MALWAACSLFLFNIAYAIKTATINHVDDFIGLIQTSMVTKSKTVYTVLSDVDIKTYDFHHGISIIFDKNRQALVAVAGIGKGLASITYDDFLSKDGWGNMWVDINHGSGASNSVGMYAAGLAEGLSSAKRISQFYSNVFQSASKDENTNAAIVNIKHSFERQLAHMMNNANLHAGTTSLEPADPYWRHIRYVLLQMQGILDGYNINAFVHGVRELNMVENRILILFIHLFGIF